MIYLDNAATTAVDIEVLKQMNRVTINNFHNPSAAYKMAAQSKKILEWSRNTIAAEINALPENIIFTSGGTESDNLAIKGTARALKKYGNHIIVSPIEHKAVLNSVKALEKDGFEISYVKVDKDGIVDIDDLIRLIRPETIMICIMYANNETGVIQPVKKIGGIAHCHGIVFMCDAVQAVGNLKIDVKECGINLLTASAHKFNGPKGTGFLYASDRNILTACIDGGGQEGGLRSGTENVPGIYGMALALKKNCRSIEKKTAHELRLRNYIINELTNKVPCACINGSIEKRLPNNVNIRFKGINAAALVLLLDEMGIMVSSGSACSAKSPKASHVLTAMGIDEEAALSSIRITLSGNTRSDEVKAAVNAIKKSVFYLREQ